MSVSLIDDIKKHLLCGMAYEIYYDKLGMLRDSFKSDFYLKILKLLYEEQFQMCKGFISAVLSNETSRLIFIPSSEEKMAIHLECERATDVECCVYDIQGIYFQGKNYLHYVDDYDASFHFGKMLSKTELHNELSKLLVIPPDMLIISTSAEESKDTLFRLPPEYAFLLSYETND